MNLCDSCKYCVGLGRDAKGNIVSRRCQCPDKQFQAPIEQKCRCYIPLRPDSSAVGNGASPVTPPVCQNTMPQGTEPAGRPANPENGSPEVMRPEVPQNTAPVQEENPPKKKKAGKIVAIILVILLVLSLVGAAVLGLGVGGFLVYKYVIKGESFDVEFVDGEGNVVNPFESTDDDFFVYEYDHSANEGKTGVFWSPVTSYENSAIIEPDVGLNLRLSPDENSMRIKIMEHMDEVFVQYYLGEWAFVEHNGDLGWCSAQYLDLAGTRVIMPERTMSELLYTLNEVTPVRVAMGDNAPVICFLPAGIGVTVLNKTDEWAYILVNEISGWCMTSELSYEAGEKSSDLVNGEGVVSCAVTAPVYSEADTASDVVFQIGYGMTAHVLIKKGEYVFIDCRGNRGWILRENILYEGDNVRAFYCTQDFLDEFEAAREKSMQIAQSYCGQHVKGTSELTSETALDFFINGNYVYFGTIFGQTPLDFINGNTQAFRIGTPVDSETYKSVADVYADIFSYLADEKALSIASCFVDYNGQIYYNMRDVGGCYAPDTYQHYVREVSDGFEIDCEAYDHMGSYYQETGKIIIEDGNYVVSELSIVLPP